MPAKSKAQRQAMAIAEHHPSQLYALRRSVSIGGDGAGGETGLQRIGVLTSNAGNAHTCYYDPAADAIIYDDGLAVISQE